MGYSKDTNTWPRQTRQAVAPPHLPYGHYNSPLPVPQHIPTSLLTLVTSQVWCGILHLKEETWNNLPVTSQ